MKCLLCGTQVENLEFFLQVALCSECARKAQALRDRAKSELETLLGSLDDIVRAAMCAAGGLELKAVESLTSEEVLAYTMALNTHFRRERRADEQSSGGQV
jgi:hypothetical protein